MRYGTPWEQDELVLALYLYCQIPFARTKANNPEVVRLSTLIGRTPSSVARKLGNFGAFDPLLAKQGIVGLSHYGKADQEVWNRYYQRWDQLIDDSQRVLKTKAAQVVDILEESTPIISRISTETERKAIVLVRLGQSFFRRSVLSSYGNSCCVCGIDLPQFLVASHIVPWAVGKDSRTDPENGLCLCPIHDKAFDTGYIFVDEAYVIHASPCLTKSKSNFVALLLSDFHGRRLQLPQRFAPSSKYLLWHRENRFRSN